jgi:branched-chain amino acid aminotransferase
MPVPRTEQVWLDGRLIPFDDAKIHVLTHSLHYGYGVFEGIRCYQCDDGRSAIFQLRAHVQRLFDSAKILDLAIPFAVEDLEQAIFQTLRANHMREGYVRPLVFLGEGSMGLLPRDNPVRVAIMVWPWGAYLGEEGLERGIRAKISSFTRHGPRSALSIAKACGNYLNSILAKREVTKLGYDEAILLDTDGFVSEGSGENVFIVRGGAIKTPPLGSILEGITRSAIIQLARDKGIEVSETAFTRDELYVADEVFVTGTAAEVTPIREVDDRTIGAGSRGPITKALQSAFFDIAHGRDRKYDAWLAFS